MNVFLIINYAEITERFAIIGNMVYYILSNFQSYFAMIIQIFETVNENLMKNWEKFHNTIKHRETSWTFILWIELKYSFDNCFPYVYTMYLGVKKEILNCKFQTFGLNFRNSQSKNGCYFILPYVEGFSSEKILKSTYEIDLTTSTKRI